MALYAVRYGHEGPPKRQTGSATIKADNMDQAKERARKYVQSFGWQGRGVVVLDVILVDGVER